MATVLGLRTGHIGGRVLDRLVNGQQQNSCLSRSRQSVDLDNGRLPDSGDEVVGNILGEDVDTKPGAALRVLLAQAVQHVGRVQAGIVAQLARDHLERLGVRADQQLLLAGNCTGIRPQELAELHLNGTATSNNGVVLDRATHNHDGIVQRALRLLDELLGTAAHDDRARLGLGAAREEVVPLGADLLLLEERALAQRVGGHVVDRGLDRATARLHRALQIIVGHAAGTEHVAIGKPLSGNIANGQLAEDDRSTRVLDLLELVVENVPLGIDNRLVLLYVGDADLGVLLLALELELDVEQGDLGVRVLLGLHLKAGVRERLLECNTGHKRGVLERAALDLLHADHAEGQVFAKGHHGIHDKPGEEVLLVRDELGVERGGGALLQQLAKLLRVVLIQRDRNLANLLDGQGDGQAEAADDDLWVDTLLDEGLALAEELARKQHNACRAITDLGVLRLGNVHECAAGRVHNIQELHDGSAVVGNGGLTTVIDHKLVHATRTQCSADCINDGLARVDIADKLALALRRVCALLQQDNSGPHHRVRHSPGHGCCRVFQTETK
eukprot:m.221713 g.221713  ORF g.221713 m.221713 type:complete len:557 (-) comp10637_c0_seq1:26-1696(-)